MLISSNNLNSPSKTSFGAKLSNINVKDETAKSVNELMDVFEGMKSKLPCDEIPVANTKAVHSPYVAGYLFDLEKGKRLSVDFDENKRPYNFLAIDNTKNAAGKDVVKSFSYYLGHPEADNPIPTINYMEFEPESRRVAVQEKYQTGASIPDNIANSIKAVVDTILGSLGKK